MVEAYVTLMSRSLFLLMQGELFPVKYSESFYDNLVLKPDHETILAYTEDTNELIGHFQSLTRFGA